jgi:hypothetical protein
MINRIKNKIEMNITKKANGFRDLKGLRFGNCVAVKHYGSELVGLNREGKMKKKAIWLCRCDCGNDFLIRSNSLIEARTTSCGCVAIARVVKFNKDTKVKISYNSFSDVRQSYKMGAKKRGLLYKLTNEQFYEICTGNCHYCGKFPDKFRKKRTKKEVLAIFMKTA